MIEIRRRPCPVPGRPFPPLTARKWLENTSLAFVFMPVLTILRQQDGLTFLHLGPMVVAEQVEQSMCERPPPGVADHLRAEHDVAELSRGAYRQRLATVDRERE